MKKRMMVLMMAICFMLSGCRTSLISQQMVIAAMSVDVSKPVWTAVLEVMHNEENETFTVQGAGFQELFDSAEKLYGFPVYLGALQCVLFSGVRDAAGFRDILIGLQNDPRVGPNTQIALCRDAVDLLQKRASGDSICSLLTAQYTRSNDYSLKQELGVLLTSGSGMLFPLVSAGSAGAELTGYVPSGSHDYGVVWPGNAISDFLSGRITASDISVEGSDAAAQVNLRNFSIKKADFSDAEHPIMTIAVTAVLENLGVSTGKVSREWLENGVRREVLSQIGSIQKSVVEKGSTDLFSIGRRAVLSGISLDPQKEESLRLNTEFSIRVNLQDPKELLVNPNAA